MDWNGNMRPFVARPENSFSFLYNYNYDQFQGMEVKHPAMGEAQHMVGIQATMDKNNSYGNQDKKKRLTAEQLDSLESSFQEEIKLDPDRKMKLARELSLQPRQIAVWFQNRRARWKNKQLECLYDTLKQEFEAVSREKLKLQEEVMKLKAMLREQVVLGKQVSTGYNTEASAGEETVESTSVAAIRSSNKQRPAGGGGGTIIHHQIGDCNNYLFNAVEDYNPVSSTYWTALRSNQFAKKPSKHSL